MLTIFVIALKPRVVLVLRQFGQPSRQPIAKDENKGIVGTWEVDVIDPLRPAGNEPIVINFGSDSFEGTDLDRIRAHNIGHVRVSGQCIEHVVATTIKRAANTGYNAILIKDVTSGFTDSNYSAMVDNPAPLLQDDYVRRIHAGGSIRRHRARCDDGIQKFLFGTRRLAAAVMRLSGRSPGGAKRYPRAACGPVGSSSS